RARLAERAHRLVERDELVHRMFTYDDGGIQRARWTAPARLTVDSPSGHATVTAQAVQPSGLGPRVILGVTPVADAILAAGSYLVTLRVDGRAEVRAPILLARGEGMQLSVPVPRHVPAGYVFVPAGRFLYGSNDNEDFRRSLLNAQPLHATTTPAYLIARHEVTFGDWIEFLRDLSPVERAQRLPRAAENAVTHADAAITLTEPTPGRFHLAMQPTSRRYTADEDHSIHYESRSVGAEQRWQRIPVSGISWDDAVSYATWLERARGLSKARPCDEREWERAARGADARLFPSAGLPEPSDANVAETYSRQPDAFGPDEVGSHPGSDSVFGVADLAGNAWEWVASVSGDEQVAIRGGGWYHNQAAARSNNREPAEPSLRAITLGLRICATPPDEPPAP
ncbi:MAG: formylglycine-generating enzyme family protein, partial [Myxococcales bacterium]|nr:formylglycine-generating enzyme family protein [Myxococcales bacterium]